MKIITALQMSCIATALLIHGASAATVGVPLRPRNDREKAPGFSLEGASGRAIRLSDYRGRIVLLNFWATDCGGCRLELPSFAELDEAYKSKGLAVLGVSMDISYESLKDATQAWSRVKPFVHAHGINYAILMGDDAVAKVYRIKALPVTYLIDASGRIAATYVGVVNKENLEANIKHLLGEMGPTASAGHLSGLMAKLTLPDGATRTVTLEGVGCSINICSRTIIKGKASGDSLVGTRLDTIAAIKDTGGYTALLVLQDGTQRRISLVRDFRVLYIANQSGGIEKLDLAKIKSIEFLIPSS